MSYSLIIMFFRILTAYSFNLGFMGNGFRLSISSPLCVDEESSLQLKLCFNDAQEFASRTLHHPPNIIVKYNILLV